MKVIFILIGLSFFQCFSQDYVSGIEHLEKTNQLMTRALNALNWYLDNPDSLIKDYDQIQDDLDVVWQEAKKDLVFIKAESQNPYPIIYGLRKFEHLFLTINTRYHEMIEVVTNQGKKGLSPDLRALGNFLICSAYIGIVNLNDDSRRWSYDPRRNKEPWSLTLSIPISRRLSLETGHYNGTLIALNYRIESTRRLGTRGNPVDILLSGGMVLSSNGQDTRLLRKLLIGGGLAWRLRGAFHLTVKTYFQFYTNTSGVKDQVETGYPYTPQLGFMVRL